MRQRSCAAQLCPTCGHLRSAHQPRDDQACPVPHSVLERLRSFKADHGTRWKSVLCELWFQGQDANDCELRHARNMIGPTGVYRLKI
jgi:hypothetical protein